MTNIEPLMRRLLLLCHRWFGLSAALFLFIAGLTGAIIAWEYEIDAWINPDLYEARTPGTAQDPVTLATAFENAEPRLRVMWLPLSIEPGQTLQVGVRPRVSPQTGQPYDLGYDQVALDPVTGAVQGSRQSDAFSLARHNLMPFINKLHHSLHLPEVGGLETGTLFMGLLAVAWVLDCVIALSISFPTRRQWRRSLAFRRGAGRHKMVFDLHRSGGVWVWLLVLTSAVTAVAMNLGDPVLKPVVEVFSKLTPSPLEGRAPIKSMTPVVTRRDAVALAVAEGARQGWVSPVGALYLNAQQGVWSVGFFKAGASHGDRGLGNPWLHIDALTGKVVWQEVPGEGSGGDVFMQAMFPLHSGRILGLPGRILVTALGLAVATLSVTGVLIWARKRRARLAGAQAAKGRAAASEVFVSRG